MSATLKALSPQSPILIDNYITFNLFPTLPNIDTDSFVKWLAMTLKSAIYVPSSTLALSLHKLPIKPRQPIHP
jgi:hypothetical protein